MYPIAVCLNSIEESMLEQKIVHNISLFSAEHSLHKNAMEVLAPPVADYFKCGSQLVPYSKAIEWCKGSTEK